MISESDQSKNLSDKFYLTYILFYALGTVTQVPQYFYTTATDYWMYKFRDPSTESDDRTGLQASFTSIYTIVIHVSSVVFLIVAIVLHKKVSIVKRIVGSLSGASVTFAITIVFVDINTDSWQLTFFVITMAVAALLTGFCTIFSITMFEVAAKFPPDYLNAVLSGHSICGIFSALAQIFSLGIGASSQASGGVYFLIGTFFMFITLMGFCANLVKSKFLRHNLVQETEIGRVKITKKDVVPLLNKVKLYLIAIVINVGVSVMVHPAVTSLVVSCDQGNDNQWNDVFFVPVVSFLIYNIFECGGREMARKLKKPRNGYVILGLSLCRVLLVPLLLLCNAQPRQHLPVIFNNDYAYIIFVIIFASSNGFLINLCVTQMLLITNDDEKKPCMLLTLVTLLVTFGAISFVSAAVVKIL